MVCSQAVMYPEGSTVTFKASLPRNVRKDMRGMHASTFVAVSVLDASEAASPLAFLFNPLNDRCDMDLLMCMRITSHIVYAGELTGL